MSPGSESEINLTHCAAASGDRPTVRTPLGLGVGLGRAPAAAQ
jgi:hypothetical protein